MRNKPLTRKLRTLQRRSDIELVVLIFLGFFFICWGRGASIGDSFAIDAPSQMASSGFDREHIVLRVDLNEADKSELTLLPRIGGVLADRIIEYREINGDFEKVDDLVKVKGIGEKTLVRVRPFCSVAPSDNNHDDDSPTSGEREK